MSRRWRRLGVAMGLVVISAGCREAATGIGLQEVAAALPAETAGWQGGELARYDPESIFSYIDGHAEVYLAYGMQGCAARRYEGPAGEPVIVVDIFELASPADAFGVFTYDRDGDEVAVGEGGLLRHGWLSAWQGRFFVSVYAEAETAAADAAVLALGRAAAAAIPAAGGLPAIVGELPAAGLEPRSVRFLRDHQVLNTHLWVSTDNVLALGRETAAALGRYRRDDDAGHLVLVRYRDAAAAAEAFRGFSAALLGGDRDGRPVADESGSWWAAGLDGDRVTAVLGASTVEFATALLAEARTTGGEA